MTAPAKESEVVPRVCEFSKLRNALSTRGCRDRIRRYYRRHDPQQRSDQINPKGNTMTTPEHNRGTTYWHGGRRNIAVGDFIRSPYERRREMSTTERRLEAFSARFGYNRDRDPKLVYFTTDREFARAWAVNPLLLAEGGGALYRVQPTPAMSIAVDPDYEVAGRSARRARVLEVVEDLVAMSEDEAQRAIKRYATWTDGGPMFDDDGYMIPSLLMAAHGATPSMLRNLGKWADVPNGHIVVVRDGRASIELKR
ncbi:hypothetical protein JNN96_30555 [Mycobacterium sp. DSM 3803]|nr:hypothetical protein [Mycobacterium sp. DSM 3803]